MTIDEALAHQPYVTMGGYLVADNKAFDVLAAEVRALRQRLDDVNVKDAAKTAEINILTSENRKLSERQAWYGDFVALRERHASSVEAAFREGWYAYDESCGCLVPDEAGCEAAWLASDAKRGLT